MRAEAWGSAGERRAALFIRLKGYTIVAGLDRADRGGKSPPEPRSGARSALALPTPGSHGCLAHSFPTRFLRNGYAVQFDSD